nr:immunoglobulin heavy chain junction region [Macaca mulatta]
CARVSSLASDNFDLW